MSFLGLSRGSASGSCPLSSSCATADDGGARDRRAHGPPIPRDLAFGRLPHGTM